MKLPGHRVPRRALFVLASMAIFFVPPPRTVQTTAPVPLASTNFTMVAQQGFGDFQNDWAWSSAWFNGRVYIGTGRNVTCSRINNFGQYPPPIPELVCPPTPATLPPTMGAQIWSVDPTSGGTEPLTQTNWIENYASPINIPMPRWGKNVMGPRDSAFRGMSVYTDPQSNLQTLYASGLGFGLPAVPPSLLGTSDGTTFQAVPSAPGTLMGNLNVLTTTFARNAGMRGQAQLGNTFYVSVTGGSGGGTALASQTPALGNNTFHQITPKNMDVWEIMSFNSHLYIGVASKQGYGVVRTDCTAPPVGQIACPPSAFTTVIPFGAGMTNNSNNDVESMTIYTDTLGVGHLYVGAGVTPLTVSTAAELTRINPDDSWDLIVGTPRTVNGVTKNPLSGFGEGFDFHQNKYMWKMAEYNGALYVGTYNIATSAYIGTPEWSQHQDVIGCNLWASPDGTSFKAITRNGFGDPYCEGIRSMTSTPYGLFIGGVNNWHGLEVWEGK